jgi:uncharacterized protein (TIGR02996 family)
MADHTGFLQAICSHPDDDGHRLVYADWLEDNGEAERAAFIRLQCQFARFCRDADEPFLSVLPADQLQPEQRQRFLAPLHALGLPDCFSRYHSGSPDGFAFYFRRGFVEDLEGYGVPAAVRFIERAEELFRLTPLRNLRILAEASSPRWNRRQGFTTLHLPMTPGPLQALLRLPQLARLRTLDLRGHLLDDRVVGVLLRLATVAPRPRLILDGHGFGQANRQALLEGLGDSISLLGGEVNYPPDLDDIPF